MTTSQVINENKTDDSLSAIAHMSARVRSQSRSLAFETPALTIPWLHIAPSTTKLWLVYTPCWSCYLKRVLSSCHFRISLRSSLSWLVA